MIWWASASSGAFTSAVSDGLGDLCIGVDVLGEIQGFEHERVTAGADEAERLAPGAHETADGAGARLAHRLEQEPIRAALRGGRPGTR